jgi:hypothetical protein
MNNLEKRVARSFKWKKNPAYCANQLGISEDEYIKIAKRIKQVGDSKDLLNHYNLDKGEAKIEAIVNYEPKSADEIIKILKIDTNEWRLSSYWNKQMEKGWRVSALITKVKEKDEHKLFKNLLDNWQPKKNYISPIKRSPTTKPVVCGILSLQDIHFGKAGNNTIDIDFESAIQDLIERASMSHHIEVLYFVIGGDLINMDTFGGSTTSGTPLDNSMTATDAYVQAFDCMHWAVVNLSNYCDKLQVVYLPGNHDRLSSFHLAHALSKSIHSENIEWDVEYAERKAYAWGENFNAFEHGDVRSKSTPLVYATEFPYLWGHTKFRTLFTGHYHQNRKVEYLTSSEEVGFVHKTLPSLCKIDYFHYHNKFIGNRRSAVLELQSFSKGTICELVYSI